jgi:serine/threonine protein kinase
MTDALRTIGRYELLRPIGVGGMAVVYLARQPDLDRLVAVKELRDFEGADPGLAERFIRESRLSGRLAHQNIVTVHDYCQFDGIPYIVMEYLRLGSLRPFIGSLTMPQIAGILEGMLSALAYAESLDVVHRDLKPENVMVTDDGRVKIADFGIAKHVASSTTQFRTRTGQAIGTPTYMSPEQALADTPSIGPRSDLYGIGVMAYEMLLGRPPFEADNPVRIVWQHVNDSVPSPLDARPDLNPAIAAWLERMLAKSPEDRPPGADAAWRELEDALADELSWTWRRQARLLPASPDAETPRPLTPAPFSEARPAEVPTGHPDVDEAEPGPPAG